MSVVAGCGRAPAPLLKLRRTHWRAVDARPFRARGQAYGLRGASKQLPGIQEFVTREIARHAEMGHGLVRVVSSDPAMADPGPFHLRCAPRPQRDLPVYSPDLITERSATAEARADA
jgi:hypothetical protein